MKDVLGLCKTKADCKAEIKEIMDIDDKKNSKLAETDLKKLHKLFKLFHFVNIVDYTCRTCSIERLSPSKSRRLSPTKIESIYKEEQRYASLLPIIGGNKRSTKKSRKSNKSKTMKK